MLIDSLTHQPVSFANVILMEGVKKIPVNGTATKDDGAFMLDNISAGIYQVSISFVGYSTKVLRVVSGEKPEINLGVVKLKAEANQLNAVVVTAQKDIIEQKVDRLVYNPGNSISSSGGDATDLLKNVPLLAVDANGNLYLKGSQNIKLLVNDKPSSLAATSLADALKQIPADMIKSVEVMTSPPSKYDAEGSAGVVNIVLKKTAELSSLNSNGSFEVRGSKITINGSVRKGKMTYGGNVFQNYSYNHPGSFANTQTTNPNDATATIFQTASTNFNSFRHSYTFNWDYDIDSKNHISSYATLYNRDDNSVQNKFHTWSQSSDISLKDTKTDGSANAVDANFTFSHLFRKPKHELTLMSFYTLGNTSTHFNTMFLNTLDLSTVGYQRNINAYSNREVTFQADYQTPITKHISIETGAKSIMRDVSVQYQYFNAASDNIYILALNRSLSNSLNYSQNVKAAYLSTTWSGGKNYDVKTGIRYEDTFINANFGDQQKISIPSYAVIVPSFNFMKKWTKGNVARFSYNRRIQRPSVQYLNPNLVTTNALNVTFGNPGLSPEFTDNYDLSFSTALKDVSLDLSGYVKSTSHAIQAIKQTVGDTIYTTYKNTGKQNVVGIDVNSTVNVSKKLSFTTDINSFYTIIEGDAPGQSNGLRNEGFSYFASVLGKYKLNSKIRAELNVLNFGNTYFLQGLQRGWAIFNISIKKDLAEKRGSIGLTAGNFITGYVRIKSSFDSPDLHQQSVNEIKNLNFKIFFSYQLIKPKGETKSRKSIKNDDLKTAVDQN